MEINNVLEKEGYKLCLEIEKLPSSELQTNISTMAYLYLKFVSEGVKKMDEKIKKLKESNHLLMLGNKTIADHSLRMEADIERLERKWQQ